jgi:hypothetical protein
MQFMAIRSEESKLGRSNSMSKDGKNLKKFKNRLIIRRGAN